MKSKNLSFNDLSNPPNLKTTQVIAGIWKNRIICQIPRTHPETQMNQKPSNQFWKTKPKC